MESNLLLAQISIHSSLFPLEMESLELILGAGYTVNIGNEETGTKTVFNMSTSCTLSTP